MVHESTTKRNTGSEQYSMAAAISAALEERKLDVLMYLFSEGRQVGHEFHVGSLAGERGNSLKVHLNGKGTVWCDFSTGDKGGDLLDLWAAVRCGKDISKAMQEAAAWLGLRYSQRGTAPPKEEWIYHDVSGNPWIKIVRSDLPGGGKFFRQYDYTTGKWIDNDGPQLPDPRPLYDLPSLSLATEVVFVEGEKCAEALKKLGFVATTTIGGALSPHKTDFSPLANKTVIIWRDHDDAGLKYQEAVAKLCLKVHARPYVLLIPEDKPIGWDIADAVEEGWTREQVLEFITQATPYEEKKILKAYSIEDFLSLSIQPRGKILSPILDTQGLAMLYSFRGVGKTYVALGIAYAVATGDKFLRWEAPTPRRVLYVDGEMPAIVMQTRMANIIMGSGKQPPSSDYLKIITPDLQERGIGNLSTHEGQAQIEEHLDGVELLILDNLSTLCRSGEENAGESWLPVQEWILSLRRRGISVLMLHHGGKSGAQRGTSKREDVLDTVICLKRPSDYEVDEGARFEVHLDKCRGIYGDDARPFEARLNINENTASWDVREVEADLVEQVIKRLIEGASQRKIASEFGINVTRVNRIAKRARAAGKFV